MNNDQDKELREALVDILEPHYWNQGEADGKEAARKSLTLKNLGALIKSREERLRDELLFDLDEIDNKPWRVFRQLAVIMPEYADIYKEYEAFYAFGGSREVQKLIDKFKETDDYKESYFPQQIADLTKSQEKS